MNKNYTSVGTDVVVMAPSMFVSANGNEKPSINPYLQNYVKWRMLGLDHIGVLQHESAKPAGLGAFAFRGVLQFKVFGGYLINR